MQYSPWGGSHVHASCAQWSAYRGGQGREGGGEGGREEVREGGEGREGEGRRWGNSECSVEICCV